MKSIQFLWFFLLPFSLFAQEQKILEIQTFLDKDRENISIRFLKNYTQEPSITYGPGWARILFPETSFEEDLQFVRINDGFIRSIRFFSGIENSGLMEIEFADAERIFSKHLDLKKINGDIELAINTGETITENPPKFEEPSTDSQEQNLPEEEIPELGISSSKLPVQGLTTSDNWAEDSLQLLIILTVLLAGVYFLLRVFRKYLNSDVSFKSLKYKVKVISSFHLSPKNKILIVEIGRKKYALGVGNHHIGLISEVPETGVEDFIQLAKQNGDLTLGELRQKYQIASQEKNLDEKEKKQTFSEELQKRLKSLKSIR